MDALGADAPYFARRKFSSHAAGAVVADLSQRSTMRFSSASMFALAKHLPDRQVRAGRRGAASRSAASRSRLAEGVVVASG